MVFAAIGAEILGYVAKHEFELTPTQVLWLKAIAAIVIGWSVAGVTVDFPGGTLTVGLVMRYLMQIEMPPEVKSVLTTIIPVIQNNLACLQHRPVY